MSNFGKYHWYATKGIMLYLVGTPNLGLQFGKNFKIENEIKGYVDSNYAKNVDTRKSFTSCVYKFWWAC